eukprot:2971170-Rhodomonas_salina.2
MRAQLSQLECVFEEARVGLRQTDRLNDAIVVSPRSAPHPLPHPRFSPAPSCQTDRLDDLVSPRSPHTLPHTLRSFHPLLVSALRGTRSPVPASTTPSCPSSLPNATPQPDNAPHRNSA